MALQRRSQAQTQAKIQARTQGGSSSARGGRRPNYAFPLSHCRSNFASLRLVFIVSGIAAFTFGAAAGFDVEDVRIAAAEPSVQGAGVACIGFARMPGPPDDAGTGPEAEDVALGDLDGDGDLDAVLAHMELTRCDGQRGTRGSSCFKILSLKFEVVG